MDVNDLFVYTYSDVFNFDRFVERMTPVVKECINWGVYEGNEDGEDVIEKTDNTDDEILNMFIRS